MSNRLQRNLKYALIRGVQSAKTVRGQAGSPWVRRFYALLAPVYDLTLLNMPGYRQAAHDLIEQLDVGADDGALDLGCGTGLLTLPLAERARRTAGLDLSTSMLARLASKTARRGLVALTMVAIFLGELLRSRASFPLLVTGFGFLVISLAVDFFAQEGTSLAGVEDPTNLMGTGFILSAYLVKLREVTSEGSGTAQSLPAGALASVS